MEKNVELETTKITKKDIIFILIITLLYSIVAFINLGSFTNPQTFWKSEQSGNLAVFKLDGGKSTVSKIRYFTGTVTGDYDFLISDDGTNFSKCATISPSGVFLWEDYSPNTSFAYFQFESKESGIYLGEIAVYDKDGNKLQFSPTSESAKLLVDEQDTVPDEISYLNSTYFDEIYFARTAYEHQHNLPAYEWTHPPLGKLIMIIPMLFMGMTPFAYRLMGTIAGILMIPTIYVFAKLLFKKTKYGVFAAIIMALDGMHFVQSRLGTSDGFLVLFIMLEYLFMYKYIISENERLRKRLWYLFGSGLFMGAAIAIKWTGVFAALGLAMVFFLSLIISIYKKKKWTKENTITILCCIVFFIVVPLVIYVLSYIPFYIVEENPITNVQEFIDMQVKMYNYHHDLDATHPYSSMWYTWPVTAKSLLYWVGTTLDGSVTRIVLLGNPAIFWFSIPCMIYTVIAAFKNRKFEFWFLIIPIIIMMASYMGISRIMFLYHYFPMLPFVMLTIVAFMKWATEKAKSNIFIYIFLLVALVVFIMFYPIYSGFPVSYEYTQSLIWLNGWIW